MTKFKFKNDKYKKSRGGYSRLLNISCASCNSHLFKYQKDGPGILKRVYLDRISPKPTSSKRLKCHNCKEVVGVLINYQKENRLAFRLSAGSVIKKIIKI